MDPANHSGESSSGQKIQRRNQILLDHSPVCHKIVDLDFNLQYMSANGFNMLKLEPDANVYGKPYPFYFFPESFRFEMLKSLKKVKESKLAVIIEDMTNDIQGNEIWLDSSLTPVFDDEGNLDYIIVVSADITRRKQGEKEKNRLEQALIQAQKMEAIGTIAGGIAHDFNNILTPIIGMSELLIEDLPADSFEYENAMAVLEAGQRGANLVKQILAFSRQTEHKLTPVKIQFLLKEVLKLLRSSIPSYIEITHDIDPDCGMILADGTQLYQIAMNIITNAYHAVEPDGGAISVMLKQERLDAFHLVETDLEPGEYAVFSVSDTGKGISEENLEKIFDPYFTTKEKGKGTGLGLAVVYGIIREHKGAIKVNSEIGKGTTFYVYLPLLQKEFEFDANDAAPKNPNGNERVMLVDDESAIAKLEKIMLERLGYRVSQYTSSLEALESFTANPDSYDVVISDMNMPDMTGLQLAVEIKSVRSDIPFILCTGFSHQIDDQKAEVLGVKAVLMKPVSRSELAGIVRRVLDERPAKGERDRINGNNDSICGEL